MSVGIADVKLGKNLFALVSIGVSAFSVFPVFLLPSLSQLLIEPFFDLQNLRHVLLRIGVLSNKHVHSIFFYLDKG